MKPLFPGTVGEDERLGPSASAFFRAEITAEAQRRPEHVAKTAADGHSLQTNRVAPPGERVTHPPGVTEVTAEVLKRMAKLPPAAQVGLAAQLGKPLAPHDRILDPDQAIG